MQFIFIDIFIFYFNNQRRQALFEFSALLSQQRQPHSWGLHNSVSINNLYLLKRYQPRAEGIINIICCARSRCLLHHVCVCVLWMMLFRCECVFSKKVCGAQNQELASSSSHIFKQFIFRQVLFLHHIKDSSGFIGSSTSLDHVLQTFGDCWWCLLSPIRHVDNMWCYTNVNTPFY